MNKVFVRNVNDPVPTGQKTIGQIYLPIYVVSLMVGLLIVLIVSSLHNEILYLILNYTQTEKCMHLKSCSIIIKSIVPQKW